MTREASDVPTSARAGRAPQRLRGPDRRIALVNAAAAILTDQGLGAVSMDTVAARAGVSRPLVYKHFANRDELLAAVYRREATRLDAAIAATVGQAHGFEHKLRALIRAVLAAVDSHGPIFTPLIRAGVRDTDLRREERARDRRTLRFFARLAQTEFALDDAQATAAMAVLLTGIESIRAQARARPTTVSHRFLEDLYVDLVTGGLVNLAGSRTATTKASPSHPQRG